MPPNLQPFFDFAIETAYLAGRMTLAHFQTGIQADYKSDRTPVTLADKAAEKLVRQRIEERFPDHAIVGEEFEDVDNESSTMRWFIDPIDGTKSFLRGVPLYAVLIGLEIEGRIEVGAAYYPALNEMLAAGSGLGCWWNGRPARVSEVNSIDQAWVSTTTPTSFDEYGRAAQFERLKKSAYYLTGWSDAYGYLLAATGRIEAMLDPIMNPWDCGPFPVIFREAGGFFGDWQGKETIYAGEALGTTQALLSQVLDLLKGD